jgi:hypothetical protein
MKSNDKTQETTQADDQVPTFTLRADNLAHFRAMVSLRDSGKLKGAELGAFKGIFREFDIYRTTRGLRG